MLADVVFDQLCMETNVARWPHQVVLEGRQTLRVVAVAINHLKKRVVTGEVRHHFRQAVVQGGLDAFARSRAQNQRFRSIGFKLDRAFGI